MQLSAEAQRALLTPGQAEVEPAWSFPHQSNLIGGGALSPDGASLYQCNRDKLFCLDAATGQPRWDFPGKISSPPVVGEKGLVFVTTQDGKFHAVNPADGQACFSVELPGGARGARLGPAGEVVVECGGRTLGLSQEDGSTLWSSPVTGPEVAVGRDGRMFAAGDDLKCVVGYDRDSGAELWRQSHGQCRHRPAVGPDGTVYLGNVAGKFMALDPANGEIKWSYDTGSHILESPTMGPDGTIYAGNLAGQLFAFDPVKQGMKWCSDVGAEVRQPPGIGGDGSVVLASDRNLAMAFEPEHGGQLWKQPAASYVHCTPLLDAHGKLFLGANNATLYSFKVPTLRVLVDDLTRAPLSHDAPGIGYGHGSLLVGQTALHLKKRA